MFNHLDKMAKPDSKSVVKERLRCLKAAKKEAKKIGLEFKDMKKSRIIHKKGSVSDEDLLESAGDKVEIILPYKANDERMNDFWSALGRAWKQKGYELSTYELKVIHTYRKDA